MRQRLSSEPDRYRGRRRVPTPPRSRYAAVVTTAFVGAGIVALGANALPDAKSVSPSVLDELRQASVASQDAAARADSADRATRDDRSTDAAASEQDPWLLPLHGYDFKSPYGVRWGKLHTGIDLVAPEGTPYKAIHSGTVTKAGWFGGYGYAVIVKHSDGSEAIYGHSSAVTVKEGQEVKAGDQLGLVGNTGHSYGSHLHLEVHVNGQPLDPVPWLQERGVDIKLETEALYGDVAAS
ncbi:M23 family metallopeptidase [Micromonospora sp. WMMA1998]|uniref:Murein DD-endopeptidase MepM and murein hydrolase activator NlpD, contain LysM domain n=1 Tax=Micromonospora sediminicola TaxID=946078 RepID=A0A1A9B5S6_9ACTN|nr:MULTISPECIES: M23 family metallopeptidase [Micromonospora]ATO16485.1 M23 family peptidase [Micromonospora sp. WMMA2032]PGH42728.1 M23 family peptidase [Micromonospora sp. WMMA1996]WBC12393.1 M23 family metallopeptidase [Micromonospora sp. WMMA1998]SBT64443.1 Murein DD-endopeptidase MepM and murein hydrolase activator NlpD, contain LysM domain [Micromonospora sediminicola]